VNCGQKKKWGLNIQAKRDKMRTRKKQVGKKKKKKKRKKEEK